MQKKEKVLVLGCGLVGKTIAKDLAKRFLVVVADIDEQRLAEVYSVPNIETTRVDLSVNENLKLLSKDYQFIISAVPGFMGFTILRALVELGKKVVDISFFLEDPFVLQHIAKNSGATAIVDSGIAPGFSNMIVGNYYNQMEIEKVTIYVGGLPFARHLPFEYKAPFSPIDVLEEYIRPARFKHAGKIIERPALSEVELIDFEEIGTLEAFLTDGVRTLLRTLDIPNIQEKTLRYPGFSEKICFLRECGFLSTNPIQTKNGFISPLEVTSALLFPKWKLSPNDLEFTVLKVIIEGLHNSSPKRIEYLVFDRTDVENADSSMARTTGFTANALMNLLLNGNIEENGILTPEEIAFDSTKFHFVIQYLTQRNISVQKKET